jgi:hypothetical protein
MLVYGHQRVLMFCDYASAGTQGFGVDRFRTWLPQPLDLGSVYEIGATWKTVSSDNV